MAPNVRPRPPSGDDTSSSDAEPLPVSGHQSLSEDTPGGVPEQPGRVGAIADGPNASAPNAGEDLSVSRPADSRDERAGHPLYGDPVAGGYATVSGGPELHGDEDHGLALGARSKSAGPSAAAFKDWIFSDPEGVRVQAEGVRSVAEALLAHYEINPPNSPGEVARIESAKILLLDLIVGIDHFTLALDTVSTEADATEAGRIYGETILRTLEAWQQSPLGAAAVKTALGVVCLGAAAICSPVISGSFAFGVLATGVYGKDAIEAVRRAVRSAIHHERDGDSA